MRCDYLEKVWARHEDKSPTFLSHVKHSEVAKAIQVTPCGCISHVPGFLMGGNPERRGWIAKCLLYKFPLSVVYVGIG